MRSSNFLILLRNTEFSHAHTAQSVFSQIFKGPPGIKNFTRFRTFNWRYLGNEKRYRPAACAILIFSSYCVILNFLTPIRHNRFFSQIFKGPHGIKNFTRLRTFNWRYLGNEKRYRPAACAILIFSCSCVILKFLTPVQHNRFFRKFS